MKDTDAIGHLFDLEYERWEKYRMYPPNHERNFMITLNDSHIRALVRAQHFVRSGISKSMSPKLIESINLDIKLLDQVKDFCHQQIMEPGLPMVAETIEVGDIGEDHGDTD